MASSESDASASPTPVNRKQASNKVVEKKAQRAKKGQTPGDESSASLSCEEKNKVLACAKEQEEHNKEQESRQRS